MALTQMDKMKIRAFFKKYRDIYYHPQDILPNSNFEMEEFFNYLAKWLESLLESKDDSKMILRLSTYLGRGIHGWRRMTYSLSEETLEITYQCFEKYFAIFQQAQVDTEAKKNMETAYQALKEHFAKFKENVPEKEVPEEAKAEDDAEKLRVERDTLQKSNDKAKRQIEKLKRQNQILAQKGNVVLPQQIQSLQKELQDKEETNTNLRDLLNQQQNSNERLREELRIYQDALAKIKEKQGSLEDENHLLRQEKASIRREEDGYKEIINALRKQCDVLEQRVNLYYHQEQKKQSEKEFAVRVQQRDSERMQEIEILILDYLKKRQFVTFRQIIQFVNKTHSISHQELSSILKNLELTFCIEKNDDTMCPSKYSLKKGRVGNGSYTLKIPQFRRTLKILLAADFHFVKYNLFLEQRMDSLYTYTSKNQIHDVFVLGDFFGYKCKKVGHPSAEELIRDRKESEIILSKLPYDENINMFVMGGNHDEDYFSLGYDSIAYLTSVRRDYFSLGYDHAKVDICMKGGMKIPVFFHHFNERLVDLQGNIISADRLNSRLKKWYKGTPFWREDTFLDFHGHAHLFYFDEKNRMCIVPSFGHDRIQNGAVEMSIYYDEFGQVEETVLKPLVMKDNSRLEANGKEYVYRKSLKK